MQTNNSNPVTLQGSDFVTLNRLGGAGWTVVLPYPSFTRWWRKKSVARFHEFLPKTMTSWDCESYLWLKKFTKVNADQISGVTKQSFWTNQLVDDVKMLYNICFLTFSDKTRWCITWLYHMALYVCLIFVNRKKNCRRKLSFYFCNTKRDHSVLTCFIVCID